MVQSTVSRAPISTEIQTHPGVLVNGTKTSVDISGATDDRVVSHTTLLRKSIQRGWLLISPELQSGEILFVAANVI